MANLIYSNNTKYKAVFKFSEVLTGKEDYTVMYSPNAESVKFITRIQMNKSDGNTNVNLLGVAIGDTACLEILDVNSKLDPDNSDSPYYNCLVDGIPVDMFIDDGNGWEDFGKWYTTSFDAEFSDGGYIPVSVGLQDKLNIYGNTEIDFKSDAASGLIFAGIDAKTLIENVCKAIGISASDVDVDSEFSSIDTYGVFGVASGTLFRDFLNKICQSLMARANIDKHGVLHVTKWNTVNSGTSNTWSIDGYLSPISGLSSSLQSAAMYESVVARYYNVADCDIVQLASKVVKVTGDSSKDIFSLEFGNTTMSIENVLVTNNNRTSSAKINNVSWSGWNSGINVYIDASEAIEDVSIKVFGLSATKEAEETDGVSIEGTVRTMSSKVFYFDTNKIMTSEKATALASAIATYMSSMKYKKRLADNVYNPKIEVGDTVVLTNCTASYNGTYKVTDVNISIEEQYNCNLGLLKIS